MKEENKMKVVSKSLLFYLLSAVGISLTIKASIGVSSFNSINVSIANLSSIKVGNITTGLNLLFLAGCVILDKDRSVFKYVLMFVATLCFGTVINFVYYTLFSGFEISNYILRVLLFIVGVMISGFGTGQVIKIGWFKFPIESCCELLEARTAFSFKQYRYLVDIVCVTLALAITFIFQQPLVVREGTILSLFLLSSMIGWSKNWSLSVTLNKLRQL